MELRPERFERQLASEPLKPVYLIAGSEPLLVLECADALRRRARAEGYGEREVFDAEDGFDWNVLAAGVAALSLFATRRLFDLRLPSGRPGTQGAETLRQYCEQPPPDTVLLVTAQQWSKKHAGKWSEAIARVGHVVPAWPLKAHEQGEWLQRRLRARGLAATPAAVALLAERVEGNLLAAAQEIDKLALLRAGVGAAGQGGEIDATSMQSLIADSARYDAFGLVEAALAGDASRSVRMLQSLRREGEQVPGLLPALAMELLRLARLARVQDGGGNLAAAMREEKVWDSKQALYRRALDRHPVARWEAFVGAAGRVERMAKGRESGDAWLGLERLLAVIAEPRARRLLAG